MRISPDVGMFLLFVGIILIVILVLALKKDNNEEPREEKYKKCICTSRNERNCQDDDLVKKLYEENKLTEYTNLKSKGWQNESENPGAITYPVSVGCPWADKFQPKWKGWDFTEFIG